VKTEDIVGVAAAIAIASIALAAVGAVVYALFFSTAPNPCVDTVTLVSAIPGNPSEAGCRPDQTMETSDRMQGIVVRCTCQKGHAP
jgi:hypothetical protein